jgi:hypothetical protein
VNPITNLRFVAWACKGAVAFMLRASAEMRRVEWGTLSAERLKRVVRSAN